jgi:nucleotide-binding universal stress UspA family protein
VNDHTEHRIPQQLLLATDLCMRCDRPLDRAKQLASEWQAHLSVLTSGARGTDRRPRSISIVIGHGGVADAISHQAQSAGTELVVLGVHRQSTLSRVFVGSGEGSAYA